MQLESVRLRRFKSLYEAEIPLSKYVVVTGPNGSGKSNFVAALDFLSETYRFGLEYAVGRAGGVDRIAYRRRRRTTIALEFSVVLRLDDTDNTSIPGRLMRIEHGQSVWFRHTFALRLSSNIADSSFTITADSLEVYIGWRNDERQKLVSISTVDKGDVRRIVVEEGEAEGFDRLKEYLSKRMPSQLELDLPGGPYEDSVAATELITDSLGAVPVVRDFRRAAQRLKVYRLNPHACRSAGVFLPSAVLEQDGANLPGVVERMRRAARAGRIRYVHAWDALLSSMTEIFPGLTGLSTRINASGGLELLFSEKGVGRPWAAAEVSDGTLAYLAMLTVLLDTRGTILVMEEPENALHSWLLRTFLEKCRTSESGQVILTTHSPVVLKSVEPTDVLLTWKRAGRTRVKPLPEVDPGSIKLFTKSGIDVFEQYDSGFVPESLPFYEEI